MGTIRGSCRATSNCTRPPSAPRGLDRACRVDSDSEWVRPARTRAFARVKGNEIWLADAFSTKFVTHVGFSTRFAYVAVFKQNQTMQYTKYNSRRLIIHHLLNHEKTNSISGFYKWVEQGTHDRRNLCDTIWIMRGNMSWRGQGADSIDKSCPKA